MWRAASWSGRGSFPAATFRELERGLAAVPWRAWFAEGVAVAVRASARRSRLFHTGKLADLVRAASLAAEPEEEGTASATVFLRVEGDWAEVSLDSSGDHLHRRGYRTWTGEAPLRENLAAGLLLRAGYTPERCFSIPAAGSGTFPVEGALLGRNLPPGGKRSFAFERFPSFDAALWEEVRDAALDEVRAAIASVYANDLDEGAAGLTARAAREAGVGDDVRVAVGDLAGLEPPEPSGLLVANPPYGRRLESGAVYGTLGKLLSGPFRRWRWGVVVAGREAGRRLGLRPRKVWNFAHGGLSLQFWTGGPQDARSSGKRSI